jgi:hypothetical protein
LKSIRQNGKPRLVADALDGGLGVSFGPVHTDELLIVSAFV